MPKVRVRNGVHARIACHALAPAAVQDAVLEGDDNAMLGGKAVEELVVELGCKARVDERGLDTVLGSQTVCHALAQLKEIAKREQGNVAALTHHVVARDAVIGALGGRQIGAANQADAGTRIATGCSRWSSDQLSMDRYSSMQAGAK